MKAIAARLCVGAGLMAPLIAWSQTPAAPPSGSLPSININTAKPSELKQLGLTNRQVGRLIWERAEGGSFKDFEDMLNRPKIGADVTNQVKPRCEQVVICRPVAPPKPKPICKKPPCFV